MRDVGGMRRLQTADTALPFAGEPPHLLVVASMISLWTIAT